MQQSTDRQYDDKFFRLAVVIGLVAVLSLILPGTGHVLLGRGRQGLGLLAAAILADHARPPTAAELTAPAFDGVNSEDMTILPCLPHPLAATASAPFKARLISTCLIFFSSMSAGGATV